MPVHVRFFAASDAEQTNALAHAAFPIAPFSAQVWQAMEEHHHLTVVAEDAGRIVGAIPLDLRDFLIRPDVSLRAAFAHMVCVDETYRAKGVGSAMMRFAKENLPQFCEGLFVYTGEEGVPPYTFYQKNGFIDLHYNRWCELKKTAGGIPAGIRVEPFIPEKIGEDQLNACYQRAYGAYAGFPLHAPGFWRGTIDGIIYVQIPTEFIIATAWSGDELSGYAILGICSEYCLILELAADPGIPGLIPDLIQACSAELAGRNIAPLQMLSSTHHPAAADLARMGFIPNPRPDANITAGMVFDFQSLWQRLTAGNPPLALHIWTPSRTLDLAGPGEPVFLEMKDDFLQRLFLCREDARAAWQAEAITSPSPSIPLDTLARIFQPAPWIFHWFEWI